METLIDFVRGGGERFADRPALIIRPSFRTRTLTHRDLADIVPRAARVLADLGLGPGDRVIIWAVNRPEWGLGFLAVAHAGGVAVPLDVRHTVEFGRKIIDQTSPKLVLASRQTEATVRELGLPIVWIESLPDLARRAEPLPAAEVTGDTLAEIVFTSGTTGEPKGAMLSHANLMSCATAMTQVMSFSTDDRLLSVLPLSHLYEQVLGFIGPLLVGASIVYPVSRQPAVLIRTFRDFKVSILLIVPQGLQLLTSAIERRVDQGGQRDRFEQLHRLARRLPRSLRRLLFRPVLGQFGGRLHTIGVGASALDIDVAQRWLDMGVQVLQGYGATEMGPVVTFTRPERNVLGDGRRTDPGHRDPDRRRRRDPGEWPWPIHGLLAERGGDRRGHRRRWLVSHGRSRGDHRGRHADIPRPQEGHARAARRAKGVPRGCRGGAPSRHARRGCHRRGLAARAGVARPRRPAPGGRCRGRRRRPHMPTPDSPRTS